MAIGRFFERVAKAVDGQLSISRSELEEVLADAVVTVVVPDEKSQSKNTAWAAEMTVNLVSRFFPTIHVVGPSREVGRLIGLAKDINPAISIASESGPKELTIVVGPTAIQDGAVFVRADGWVATVGSVADQTEGGPPNPYASAAAACLGVSALVRQAFKLPKAGGGETYSVSVLDYSRDGGRALNLAPTNIGDVAMVGLGAVGQAALWALGRHEGISGKMRLIDDEVLDLTNLQRYVGSMDSDVQRTKAFLADRLLSSTNFKRRRADVDLGAYADRLGGEFRIPTICVSVDNVEARRAAQALLPRLVVNGFTGNGSLGASWHSFDGEQACLACLYHPAGETPTRIQLIASAFKMSEKRAAELLISGASPTEEEIQTAASSLGASEDVLAAWRGRPIGEVFVEAVCGGTSMPNQIRGGNQMVPLAFQSALAGVLMAAELVKRLDPDLRPLAQDAPMVAWHDVRRAPPSEWREQVAAVAGCICQDKVYREAFQEKWPEADEVASTGRPVAAQVAS